MRVGTAAVAMVLVAEAAVWLLRPRERPIEPAPVSESDYFTPAQIDRGRAYGDGQLWLLLGAVGAQGAVLVTLALGRPAVVRRGLERLEARPVIGAAAAGAGLSVALGAAALPAGIAAHERAVDYGISTQSLGFWLADAGKSAAIGGGAGRGGRGAADRPGAPLRRPLVAARERSPWSRSPPSSSWLAPVVLAPLFNRFSPLPDGSRARSEVLALGSRAGVDIGRGVPRRRKPPGAVPERLRRRDRVDQASRPLRHSAGAGESG